MRWRRGNAPAATRRGRGRRPCGGSGDPGTRCPDSCAKSACLHYLARMNPPRTPKVRSCASHGRVPAAASPPFDVLYHSAARAATPGVLMKSIATRRPRSSGRVHARCPRVPDGMQRSDGREDGGIRPAQSRGRLPGRSPALRTSARTLRPTLRHRRPARDVARMRSDFRRMAVPPRGVAARRPARLQGTAST